MPDFTVFGNDSTAETLVGEDGFVAQNGALVVNGADAITASGSVDLTVLGTVASLDNNAVDMDGTSFKMAVGQNGFVGSTSTVALDLDISSFVDIDNAGMISSANSDAIRIDETDGSANAFIFNTGDIVGDAIIDAGLGTGIFRFINHGNADGRNDGIRVDAAVGEIFNTGNISSEHLGQDDAVLFSGTNASVASNRLDLTNVGTIHNGITSNNTTDNIMNSGYIDGDVNLGDGVDIYDGMSSGVVTGRVNGGNDSDSLFGSDADDDLRGDNQSDLLEGNGGDDDLLGGQGQDVIRGGDGNDRLFGQSNGDSLNGGAGLDRLSGGLANDTFVFEIGNDVDIIDDFANNGIEKIDLRDFASADAMAAIANAYQVGGQVRIAFGDGDLLAINGITVADLDNSDFIFA